MALVALPGPLWQPRMVMCGLPAWSTSQLQLDAAGEEAAAIVQIPKSGTLTHVHWRTGTTVTSITNVDIRLEGVDADGKPDGTLKYTSGSGNESSLAAGTWYATAINGGTGVAVTKGDVVAIVVVPTGTRLDVRCFEGDTYDIVKFPYGSQWITSDWAKQQIIPCMCLQFSGSEIVQVDGLLPVDLATAVSIAENAYRGARFQIPFPCKVDGAWAWMDQNAGSAYEVRLFDSDGVTVLASIVMDADHARDANSGKVVWRFTSEVTLAKDTWYRIAVKATNATTSALSEMRIDDSAKLPAFPGGSNHYLTTASADPTDETDWTQTTTTVPVIGVRVTALDDGSGGAGGGGIRLAGHGGLAA